MLHKRLMGVLIVCAVFVSVMLSFNGKQENVYGGYGDRNEYTLVTERRIVENKLHDLVVAVFEGKRDTVALFTVSDKWNKLDKNKRREVTNILRGFWFDIRNSSGVVIVDINGNELTVFPEKRAGLSEERRKQLETAAKFGITEEELDNLTAFSEEFSQLEAHKQEEFAHHLFMKDYPYNLSPALIDKDGDGKNSINDWRRMNLKEKRQQAIYNLIRANKAVTKESVDTMINNLNGLAALR